MKTKLAATLLIFFAFALTACTMTVSEPVPTQASESLKPAETVSEPVTRADYPKAFLPGIDAAGAIPSKGYHIGIVLSKSSAYAKNAAVFEELGKAYAEAFDMTVTVEQTAETAQRDCVERMLGSGIDLLIFAMSGNETEAGALCAQSGIPYITIGQRTQATPGEGTYVCTIEPDDFLCGILTGQSIIETMTAQYGEPFGNIAEITGVVSDEASILRSSGLRHALLTYDKLNVVCSVAGNDDKDMIYKAAENIFKACRVGELDGIVVPNDSAALTVLQAALDYDRDDVTGRIWSTGATAEGLIGVYYGQIAQTIETASQTGMAAMEYAIRYLNGGRDFPAVITSLTRVFAADTPEKKDAVKTMIAALNEHGAAGCLESLGDYAPFLPDENISNYPQRYDLYTDISAYLAAYEPYTTEKAIYGQRNGG